MWVLVMERNSKAGKRKGSECYELGETERQEEESTEAIYVVKTRSRNVEEYA